MTPYYADDWLTILEGDCRAVLPSLPADSVDCVVTSPPYWGLRDYGTATWSGGDEACDHIQRMARGDAGRVSTDDRGPGINPTPVETPIQHRERCPKCGATRQDSQLGLERTPEEYVANMVAVFAEVRRVLKPSGTCWLNLGASFASSGGERTYGSSDNGVGRGPGTRRYRASAGDSDPSQSPEPSRAPAYGTDGTGPGDSPGPDSAYRDLCDGCRGGSPNRHVGSAGTLDRPSDASSLDATDRDSERSDSEQASPDASPLDAQESTMTQSELPPPGQCSHCGRCGACLSVLRSSWPDARACARKPWLNYTAFKPKDMVPIPWMVAMALQADGWYLRSDIIWSKPNPMPESVTDRPTKSHEYLFLLTKSPRYYFDADAVREANRTVGDPREGNGRHEYSGKWDGSTPEQQAFVTINPAGRNIRSVWTIATRPYPGAHFAVFPPELPERCIKAGSSEHGVCPMCGAPWERAVERERITTSRNPRGRTSLDGLGNGELAKSAHFGESTAHTTGWHSSCAHTIESAPAVILDLFAGSGTVGMVANRLSRRAILIDLNPEYLRQQMTRNAQTPLGLGAA